MPFSSSGYTLLPVHSVPNTPLTPWQPTFSSSIDPTHPSVVPKAFKAKRVLLSLLAGSSILLLGVYGANNAGSAVTAPLKQAGNTVQGWVQDWRAGTSGSDASSDSSEEANKLSNTAPSNPAQPPSKDTSNLPTCQKTLLYRFAGAHGFASEYLIFLRLAVLAKYYNYAFFVDDSNWNYGRLDDYFLPIQNKCALPTQVEDWARTPISHVAVDAPLSSIHTQAPQWTYSPHVIWSTRRLNYLDSLFLALFVDGEELRELHIDDILQFPAVKPLDARMTVPKVFKTVFGEMSKGLEGLWRLNGEMEGLAEASQKSFGWRAEKDAQNKRTVIAAHIRLGDKAEELSNYGPHVFEQPPTELTGLHESWMKHHEAAKASISITPDSDRSRTAKTAREAEDSIISDQEVDAYMQASIAALESARGRFGGSAEIPQLLLMSDDTTGQGLRKFHEHPDAGRFEIVTKLDPPPDSSSSSTTSSRHSVRSFLHTLFRRSSHTRQKEKEVKPGFVESAFNEMDISQRVAMTKTFLRDMTVLAQRADGLVFTGSSNVGRLMSLLAGKEKMREGRLRSTDVRWFPTVRYQ